MRRYLAICILAAFFCLATAVCYAADRKSIVQRADNTQLAIFVHGFTGDHLETWGDLPQLLQTDERLETYDFLFWGYPSHLFRKNEDIGTTGKYLKSEIDYLNKPYHTIVLIGHSMGGLVIRSYIVQALIDGKGKDLKLLADVILFGVPNDGDLKPQLIPEWVHSQIGDMGVASHFIVTLRRYWIQRVTAAPRSDDFYRQIPTLAVAGYADNFVTKSSVESFFRDTAMTDGDHRSIVKPDSPEHLTYRIIRKRLLALVDSDHKAPPGIIEQSLAGVILDTQGNPLPGVTVTLPVFSLSNTTDTRGIFSFEVRAEAAASVRLMAQKPGYQTHRQDATLGNMQLSFTLERQP